MADATDEIVRLLRQLADALEQGGATPFVARLARDFTPDEVGKALGMTASWVRDAASDGAAHIRRGNKIFFTVEQVEQLRHRDAVRVRQSVTTGPDKSGLTPRSAAHLAREFGRR